MNDEQSKDQNYFEELRKLDYEKTLEFIKQLTEIRFKLLALLPLANVAGLSIVKPGTSPMYVLE